MTAQCHLIGHDFSQRVQEKAGSDDEETWASVAAANQARRQVGI